MIADLLLNASTWIRSNGKLIQISRSRLPDNSCKGVRLGYTINNSRSRSQDQNQNLIGYPTSELKDPCIREFFLKSSSESNHQSSSSFKQFDRQKDFFG